MEHLIDLIQSGDVTRVEQLLARAGTEAGAGAGAGAEAEEGAVNAVYETHEAIGTLGFTPLCLAVYYARPEIVALCIKQGARVDAGDSYRQCDGQRLYFTAPLLAALEGHSSIMDTLLNAGADMDAPLRHMAWLSEAQDPLRDYMAAAWVDGGRGDGGRGDRDSGSLLQLMLQRPPHLPVMRVMLSHGALPALCDPQHLIARACQSADFSLVLLLVQEAALSLGAGDVALLFEESAAADVAGRRRVLEVLAERGDFAAAAAAAEDYPALQAAFSSEQPWGDAYTAHLGTVLPSRRTQGSDDHSEDDSEDDEEEEGDVECTECSEAAVAALCRDAGVGVGGLDADTVRWLGLCWLRHVLCRECRPRRLKSLCRNVIRRCIGPRAVVPRLRATGLPAQLQQYLLFRPMY